MANIKMIDDEYYSDETFWQMDLAGQLLRGKRFDNCKFIKCDFTKTDLTGSEFSDCLFGQSNLSLTKFLQTRLSNVLFENSKLVGVDFTKCTVHFFELAFRKCLMDTCNFSALPMTGTLFETSTIRACVFGETNLSKATFTDCDLDRTVFHATGLQGADFSFATNYQIDPTSCDIKGAQFSLPEAISLLQAFDITLC